MSLVLDVDRHRWGRTVTCRTVWRALSDGARSLPDHIELENPMAGPPEFRAASGCSLGKSHYDAEHGVFGYELLLDRPLRLWETAVTEYELDFPGEGKVDTYLSWDLPAKFSETVLWVRFDPAALPATCETFVVSPDGSTSTTPVSLAGTTSAHHVVHNFGPAEIGIRWSW
ncbi:MAG: hypothetical protein ACRCYQ_15660 [Nocardioides sp.]